jgi:hypothetical protein
VLLVVVFLTLLLSLLGVTYRQTASVLRLETARSQRILTSEVDMRAAAMVLGALERLGPNSEPPPSLSVDVPRDPEIDRALGRGSGTAQEYQTYSITITRVTPNPAQGAGAGVYDVTVPLVGTPY